MNDQLLLLYDFALGLAEIAYQNDEVPVGAVYFDNGKIIAQSGNVTISDCDPSGHAEIAVLRLASKFKNNHRIGGILAVTLEPCVMCMGALIQARVERLIFGSYDHRSGASGSVFDLSNSPHLNHKIEVIGGVMETECKSLMQHFFRSKR